MASYPPPPPPAGNGPVYGAGYAPGSAYDKRAWKTQRRAAKAQARWARDQYRMQRRSLRQRSVVGPLVLVSLGVVLLLEQTGRLSWGYSLAWYASWWPVVLIVAGVILLGEWILDQHSAEELGQPRSHTLSAGAVFLLILLAAVGLSARWVDHGAWWNGHAWIHDLGNLDTVLGEAHESDSSLNGSLPAGGTLVVHDAWGAINVTGSSSDGQVHVSVHKQVYAWSNDEAAARAQRIQPAFSLQGNTLTLSVPATTEGQADLTIEMPHNAVLSVSGDHGDIHVSELHGDVTVGARKGDVELSGITGAVLAQVNDDDSSVSVRGVTGSLTLQGRAGDISLSNVSGQVMLQGDFFGTTEAEQINGPLRFETSRTKFSAARIDGDLSIESGDLEANKLLGPVTLISRNRTVELDDVSGSVSISNKNGDISVTSAPPLGSIDIKNEHGSVDLGLPEHAGFSVDAQAKNGSLENDFGLNLEGDDALHRLSGTVASGGPSIRVTTSDGDVTIRKAVATPIPPASPAAPKVTMSPAVPSKPGAPSAAVPAAPKAPPEPTSSRSRKSAAREPREPAEPAEPEAPAAPPAPRALL